MQGVHQGMPQGSKDIQDRGKKWEKGRRSCRQELLHRVHDMRYSMQTWGDTAGSELVK